MRSAVFDHHLMPLRGEGEPEIDTAAQEKAVTA
jgi:hypothetical protein